MPPIPLQTPLGLVDVSQQPVAHDAASQMHWPATQCRFGPQGAPLPHWQVPLAQRSAVKLSQAPQLALAQ